MSQRKHFMQWGFALVLMLSVVFNGHGFAQTTTQGSITGTVEDNTGAVIPTATIKIINDNTNSIVTLAPDSSGYFKDPLVEPGTYTVIVTATGFAEYRANKVTVQVSQVTNVEAKLTPGATSTVVQVTSAAPIMNFESPDFSSVISTTALQNIPVNNRRWSALALTTPGVVADSSGFGLVSVRGISTILNNVEIDGADDNQAYYSEERGRTREAYSTSGAAVREFNMNTGVYSAEFGRSAGGVINSVTKSGTNAIHGQVYFYDRESNWNAFQEHTLETVANYTNNNPVPSSFTSIHFKPEDVRKIYGFTAGGPIIKDKLFFIYTYDQHSRIFPAIGSPGTPATFFAQPDTVLPSGTCNTATGYLTGTTSSNTNYTLDSQACTLAAREGLASYTAGANAYSTGLGSLLPDLGYTPRAGYQEINTPKLDWQITPKEHFSVLYHRLRWDSPGGVQTAGVVGYAIDSQGNDFVKLDYGVAKLTSQITSKIGNELLFQYGRELDDEGQQPFSAYTLANLKATNGNIPAVCLDNGTCTSTSTGFLLGSPYYSYRPANPLERKWQMEDVLYYSHGNHSIKFGADLLHNWDEINALNGSSSNGSSAANGEYTYPYIGNYLADLYSKTHNTGGTCDSLQQAAATATASAVGGYQCYTSKGYSQTFGNPVFAIATMDVGAFVQDNWKVSPRLTLEMGLRYDVENLPSPPSNLANAAVLQTQNHPTDKNNFGPRVGFAYDLYGGGKTVLRGGYGMYYGRVTNGILLNVLLNTGSANGQYTSVFSPTATSTVSPTLPNNYAGAGALVSPGVYYLSSHLQNPMVHEFDLILQQDLGKQTVLTVSYLGSLGRTLTNFLNTNLDPTTVQTTNITFVDTTGLSKIPNGTVVPVNTYTHYTNTAYQGITQVISNINSSYHGLVAEVQNHSWHSLQFDANYTWSHSLDFAQNANTTTTTNNWLDPYAAARTNYGNSIWNVPNRAVVWALYNLPNKAKPGSWLSYLANDWSLDDSFQGQSGLPYSAATSGSTSSNSISTGWNGTGVTAYIPTLGRNTYKYPRHLVDDARVQKDFTIHETYKVQLLLNVFNIANKQNIDGINTTAYKFAATGATTGTATYQSAFGSVTSSNNSGFLYTPREVEAAVKLTF